MTHRFKGLDLIHRVPEELWAEVHDIVQEEEIKTIPKKKKCKKAKWLSVEALQIAEKKKRNYIEYGKIKEEKEDDVKNMINDIIEGMSFIELLKKYGKEIYYHYRDFKSLYNDIKDELKESEIIEYYNNKTKELLKNE